VEQRRPVAADGQFTLVLFPAAELLTEYWPLAAHSGGHFSWKFMPMTAAAQYDTEK
jgi:hypothetical protein